MSTNFVQDGEILTVAAPTGGVTSGLPVVIGDLAGVPVATAAVGVDFAWQVEGVHSAVKSGSSGPVFAVGDPVYWTGALATTDPSYAFIGTAVAAAGASATSVLVTFGAGIARRRIGRMLGEGTTLATGATAEAAHAETLTIPAGTLRAGDIVRLSALVSVDGSTSTDQLTTKLKFGATAVATQAAHDVADADFVRLTAEINILAIDDAAGSIGYVGEAWVQDDTPDKGAGVATSLNTEGAFTVSVSATWSAGNGGNQTTLRIFNYEIVR